MAQNLDLKVKEMLKKQKLENQPELIFQKETQQRQETEASAQVQEQENEQLKDLTYTGDESNSVETDLKLMYHRSRTNFQSKDEAAHGQLSVHAYENI